MLHSYTHIVVYMQLTWDAEGLHESPMVQLERLTLDSSGGGATVSSANNLTLTAFTEHRHTGTSNATAYTSHMQ